MSLYLIGNPLLANRMYEQHPAVGLYAPLRASIYEDMKASATSRTNGLRRFFGTVQKRRDSSCRAHSRWEDGKSSRPANGVSVGPLVQTNGTATSLTWTLRNAGLRRLIAGGRDEADSLTDTVSHQRSVDVFPIRWPGTDFRSDWAWSPRQPLACGGNKRHAAYGC